MRSHSASLRLLITLSLFFLNLNAFGTHIRAGEITARRISSAVPTYEITTTLYFDEIHGGGASDAQNHIDLYAGSQLLPRIPRLSRVNIGNGTSKNIYITTYTFPSTGIYRISFEEDNRNNNVLNIGPPPTDGLNFYISTTLEINASLGLNQTPVLLNAPIDLAAVGQRYIHNPGAFDADGDSLSYKMFIPQEALSGNDSQGKNLQYVDPNQIGAPGQTEAGASPATFSLNPLTGDLIWDAPMVKGYYNVAFIVEEWRDGILIGRIVRDMQIIVEDATNDRPKIQPLDDICVEAGTFINQKVTATDKNGDKLSLTSSGGVYEANLVPPALAIFTVPNQNSQAAVSGTFTWQTGCAHIRQEPYDVVFKVEDSPGPGVPNPSLFRKLADMTTLNIRVFGPKPTNLRGVEATDPAGVAYRLTWDAYKCQIEGARIVIYRKEGCTTLPEDVCISGIPEGYGYKQIATVPVNQTTYLDNDNGNGLRTGVSYSYRIVVQFPRPGSMPNEPSRFVGGGESVASDEFCLNLPLVMPVITNVTVDSTSETKGVITVRWTRPDKSIGTPAQYVLYRAVGQKGTAFTKIATINTNLAAGAPDTFFVDKALNTVANAYRYQLEYYYTENNALVKLDVTEPASSVRLQQGSAVPTSIRLNWSAIVPWSNNNQVHRVYREDKSKPGSFNRIAEVPVTGDQTFNYTDDGNDHYAADGILNVQISTQTTYCYKVETVGSYNNTQIKTDPLFNFSQIICVSAADTARPCPPALSVDMLNCDSLQQHPDAFCELLSFTNHLSWTYPLSMDGKECDPNISAYNIYYTRFANDVPALIAKVTTPPSPLSTNYDHTGLSSFAGCYYVTAVNSFGSESAPSNLVCKENCPMFVLPNVFTPNNDGKNDIFQPMECPAFVQSVDFKVYNTWGAQVFDTKDVNINWNGKTNKGKELPAGQYYYEASVTFESTAKENKPTPIKGWVQLLR